MLGVPLHRYNEVDSTNDIVKSLGAAGATEGTAVIAEQQRQGRGRQGRSWWSPPGGNLYVSILLRPKLPVTAIPAFAPACGLGVAEALEAFASVQVELKWPNDIRIQGRKIAGVLTESIIQGEEISYLVVGVGVNLNTERFPEFLADTATSLRLETGAPTDPDTFLPVFFSHLDTLYHRFCTSGFSTLVDAWSARDAMQGRQVRLDTGSQTLEGVAKGISPSGALLLETADGLQHISAGEIL